MKRQWLVVLYCILGGAALAVVLTVVGFAAFLIFFAYSATRPPDKLPSPLDDISEADRPLVTGVSVHHLGGFIDQQYVWRFDAPPAVVQRYIDKLALKPLPAGVPVPAEFWQSWTYAPRRERPSQAVPAKFYSTPQFPANQRGPDGRHYFLMHDPAAGTVYVWLKDNF
jgi:hypothetical protein